MNGELGGLTLSPGVYKSDGGFAVTNTLYLDGENDPEAAWIFIMATSLTVNTGASVVMLNYDYENTTGINVWWSCGERADIFANAAMQGTVMAYQSIAAQNGASSGPLMANIGEVTLLTNVVNSYNTSAPTAPPTAQPTNSSTPLSSSNSDSSGLSDGAIAGIVIGAMAFAAVVVGAVFFGFCAMAGSGGAAAPPAFTPVNSV